MTMKKLIRLKSILIVAALGLLAPLSQGAEMKIAVINLKTVFDGYWKTKQSDATVKERQTEYDTERKKMVEDYQKANEEYRKLAESANDPAVAVDERDKRKKTAESKLLEIKEIESSIGQFERQFRSQLTDQIKRMRDNILRDIREEISKRAKSENYTLVLDTAGESINQTPLVIYQAGLPDITNDVLTAVNKDAPAGSLTTPAADKK
jgi:Skp family chaperone for outer membrane proteins